MHIWLRDEARDTERRSPLTPEGAAALIADGAKITVERSKKRVFPDADYEAVGCEMVASGLWPEAPIDALVLGVKELPGMPVMLRRPFCHFAHLFKEQQGWRSELARFAQGGGELFDIEYLTDDDGRRPCDRMTRRHIGARSSSVFPAPRRPMLAFKDYEAANSNRQVSYLRASPLVLQQCV